eukprot:gb/GEZN01001689.1/.p1 GENE.gb/GEZN01001689.1/~~gb/GEZN01001689.1/.p1  ORF type:complete len:644 (-),score=62.35 gb/GEZN01001689.1/:924-2855(-)
MASPYDQAYEQPTRRLDVNTERRYSDQELTSSGGGTGLTFSKSPLPTHRSGTPRQYFPPSPRAVDGDFTSRDGRTPHRPLYEQNEDPRYDRRQPAHDKHQDPAYEGRAHTPEDRNRYPPNDRNGNSPNDYSRDSVRNSNSHEVPAQHGHYETQVPKEDAAYQTTPRQSGMSQNSPRKGNEPPPRMFRDAHTLSLCTHLMTILEQLQNVREGFYSENRIGAEVFEVKKNREGGSVEVTRRTDIYHDLEEVTAYAREAVYEDIERREEDLRLLDLEIAALEKQALHADGDKLTINSRISKRQVIKGNHKIKILAMKEMAEVEVKVNVDRTVVKVELALRDETKTKGKKVMKMPMKDPYIYVMGGGSANDYNAALASVERYDVDLNSWEKLQPMHSKHWGCAGTVLNGNIHVIGGYDDKYMSSVEQYDTATNRWELVASPATNRRLASATATLHGLLYIVGGFEGHGAHTSRVEKFDPVHKKWVDVAPMTCRRDRPATAVLDKVLVVMGGQDGTGGQVWNTVEKLDDIKNRWVKMPSMLTPRRSAVAAILNKDMYIIGGHDGTTELKRVERFNREKHYWEEVAPMIHARASLGAAVLKGKLYAIGGFDGTSALQSVERYDPKEDKWEEVTPLTEPRVLPAALLHNS